MADHSASAHLVSSAHAGGPAGAHLSAGARIKRDLPSGIQQKPAQPSDEEVVILRPAYRR